MPRKTEGDSSSSDRRFGLPLSEADKELCRRRAAEKGIPPEEVEAALRGERRLYASPMPPRKARNRPKRNKRPKP
jgi:hypothetical protein